ncbi:Sec8 exocyst complex component [Myriangium duriaei CBS 260.36]|uniref:Exocyst complex component Sec8 n=1 Tax=Myriangium duriaei CBS 260.36 TaxID=1168546 RepID=A0A9P4MM52_9PEZI|nr:Sec8 exocyst complex component [Myriangium duriaei CBS 260.36]
MSWMRENGGYSNGYGNDYGKRYDYDASSRDTSADARSTSRGPGGYGGMGSEATSRVTGPSYLERRQANRRSGDQRWDTSRSRSRPGGNASESIRNVEDILRYIEQQWSFMSSNSCVPIKVALQLMDQSSLGLADQSDGFQRIHQQLQSALKAIVNEHHQGFNSSIGTFHQIQASLQLSQQRVRELKSSLVEAKSNLSISRPELKAFATSSQNYDQMLQVLNHIEELRAMPEKIEAQISDKRFLGAVDTLQEALKLIRKPEMEEIGALSDLQVYLSNQEHSITDILIEELHSHLYLKSPYCEQRWSKYAARQGTSENTMIGTERRQLYQFLNSLNLAHPLKEDSGRNPEADSFSYIFLLLEALSRMSRLDVAVDAIEQRMPVELFRVVEKCYVEVEQRHPNNMRSTGGKRRNLATVWQDDDLRKEIVEDMLSLLYARFEAIAEGHRVVHDVISGISRRHGERDASLLRSFNGLWKLYQSEIRSLLHDHLSSSGDLNSRSRLNEDVQVNMFRPHARDKAKRLFKLSDTDKTSPSIATERDDLDQILKASVPGLVTQGLSSGDRLDDSNKTIDRSGTGHKLLVEPSVFNMGILLPPSLSFLTRLREIVPNNSDVVVSTLTSFLDDFLVNVFEPQMEETLTEACDAAYGQSDAFQEDPKWQTQATKPVFKSTIEVYQLINSFCRMLTSLPPNQSFSELILGQIRAHYNRLNEIYRSIVTKTQTDPTVSKSRFKSASLAEGGDMLSVIKTLINTPASATPDLWSQETMALINLIKSTNFADDDLLSSTRSIRQLSVLFTSSTWFVARLQALRHIDPKASNNTTTSLAAHQARTWDDASTGDPYLPLSAETAQEFDSLTSSIANLSALILRTLHLELRLQTLTGINRALSTTYQLNQPFNEPDSSILSLNATTIAFDAELASHLPQANRRACVAHLPELVDVALVSLAGRVTAMDEHGARRMALNILVLQQGLKEIDEGADLALAARYWECWDRTGESILAECKAGRVSKVDAREMVRLCYSTGGDANQRDQMFSTLG